MAPAPPSKILTGISSSPDNSKELLSWAIATLARPNDTIVALHVLGEESKKSDAYSRTQYRRAKAFVISVMGEFARICQSKQVNLEARVGFSSSVGKGLVAEAKDISAEYLLVGRSTITSNSISHQIARYCFEHAPGGCSVVVIGKWVQHQQNSLSCSMLVEEHIHKNSNRKDNTDKSVSPAQKLRFSETNRKKPSPRKVVDKYEGESNSNTEGDSSTFGDSSVEKSPHLALGPKTQSKPQKPPSPLKRFSAFLCSSLDSSGREKNKVVADKEMGPPLLRCFSYGEIANATNFFHPDNLVGCGGYSEVYRGDLEDGRTIAIKRLAKDNADEQKQKEFLMELGILGHVTHRNTAVLVGCCIDNGLHLIFDFFPNGTLASALHGKCGISLEWAVRYRIAVGIARGLHYLHKCCKHRIIHRDIKASNVLLGPDYEPQISDFGLAKWLPNKWTHHTAIPIEGTFGYLAPEYFMHGIVDEKTDVFAFGVLLLEIITGRKPVDSSKQNLLLWAKPLLDSGNITELVDPKLGGKYDLDQMHTLVLTASHCIRQSSIWRPSMSEVQELLVYGDDSSVVRSWRMPKLTSQEMDDYSLVFGYDLPSDILLEEI